MDCLRLLIVGAGSVHNIDNTYTAGNHLVSLRTIAGIHCLDNTGTAINIIFLCIDINGTSTAGNISLGLITAYIDIAIQHINTIKTIFSNTDITTRNG